jgi:hypothetical protein
VAGFHITNMDAYYRMCKVNALQGIAKLNYWRLSDEQWRKLRVKQE